jgi:hypothetical protein
MTRYISSFFIAAILQAINGSRDENTGIYIYILSEAIIGAESPFHGMISMYFGLFRPVFGI